MLSPISPLSVSPHLFAGLQKIRRTPLGRLAVGYRILPRIIERPKLVPPRALAPLGARWLIERLIAGGIVGEPLPISILRTTHLRSLLLETIRLESLADRGKLVDAYA